MNIIELQDNLKDVSDNVLMREMQSPSGNMPQFLVLSELTRRRRMRDDYKRQQAANMPTVAEEVMTAAGAPQEGLTAIARNMAPNSSIAQNTGADMAVQREPTRMPQMMAEGGLVGLASGGAISVRPTGGGNYILVQNGEQVQGTGVYPDFKSADAASRAIRGVQPFQVPRVLGDEGLMPSPMVMDEGPSLQEIDPDPTAFAANDEIRRSLQMRQAMGDFRDPSTDLDIGGILAGAQQFDFDRPLAQQDATGGLPVAAPDFDATDENDILDAEEARLVQQEVLDANRGDQPLPDISQIDPETNLDISAALGIGSLGTNLADAINNQPTSPNISTELAAQLRAIEGQQNNPNIDGPLSSALQYYGGTAFKGAATDEPTTEEQMLAASGALDANYADPVEEQGILSRLFSNPLVDLNTEKGRNRTRTERTSDTLDSFYPELPVSASDVKPPMPLLENVLDQSRSIPEMPIDPSSVMPPMMGDTGGEETAAPMMPTGTDSYGALESRIAKMLADREKAAESDKYLALAQAGLALMASDSPTLAGAIGEAGLVGIGQLREARSQYDKDVLELLSTQADIDSARADRNLELQELALERDELEQTRQAQEALSKYRMASLDPRNASISDLQAGLNYINGEIQTQATTVTYDEVSGEEIEKIDMTKVDPQLLIQKKSLEDSLLTRLRGTGADFDATGS